MPSVQPFCPAQSSARLKLTSCKSQISIYITFRYLKHVPGKTQSTMLSTGETGRLVCSWIKLVPETTAVGSQSSGSLVSDPLRCAKLTSHPPAWRNCRMHCTGEGRQGLGRPQSRKCSAGMPCTINTCLSAASGHTGTSCRSSSAPYTSRGWYFLLCHCTVRNCTTWTV